MSDLFVDELFAKLNADRQVALTKAANATQSRERIAGEARVWWTEFCRVLDEKVNAWNAKDATGAHLSCTTDPRGSVKLWHRSVEAELHLAEPRVVMTGRIGDTQPRESPFIEFHEARGAVTAVLADSTALSPGEAADRLLGPILTRAFAG